VIGLVTKNAILIVEFANNFDEEAWRWSRRSFRRRDAAAPDSHDLVSTVFGILPIAIGLGAGGESRRPLGLAVVGGMLFSTFLTLIVVPVVYTLLSRKMSVDENEAAEAHHGATLQTADVPSEH